MQSYEDIFTSRPNSSMLEFRMLCKLTELALSTIWSCTLSREKKCCFAATFAQEPSLINEFSEKCVAPWAAYIAARKIAMSREASWYELSLIISLGWTDDTEISSNETSKPIKPSWSDACQTRFEVDFHWSSEWRGGDCCDGFRMIQRQNCKL